MIKYSRPRLLGVDNDVPFNNRFTSPEEISPLYFVPVEMTVRRTGVPKVEWEVDNTANSELWINKTYHNVRNHPNSSCRTCWRRCR